MTTLGKRLKINAHNLLDSTTFYLTNQARIMTLQQTKTREIIAKLLINIKKTSLN